MDVAGGSAYRRGEPFERMWRDVQAGLIMPINNHTGRELIGASSLGVELAPVAPSQLPGGEGRR
jgi:alkylation response protein AidB-like acyl-CoA dehydrogenase